jgi:hypothetical protein
MSERCSCCGEYIKELGAFGGLFSPSASVGGVGSASDFNLYEAQVCTACGYIFCGDCMTLGGPTPCLKCRKPTEPAYANTVNRMHIRKYCETKAFEGKSDEEALELARMEKVDKSKMVFLRLTKSVSEKSYYGGGWFRFLAIADAGKYLPENAFNVSQPITVTRGLFPFRRWEVRINFQLPAKVTIGYRVD